MADSPSLAALADDLLHVVIQFEQAVKAQRWSEAHTRAKTALGLASRSFARVDGIQKAMAELDALKSTET